MEKNLQTLPETQAVTKWLFGTPQRKSTRERSEVIGRFFYKQLTRHGAVTVDQLIRLHMEYSDAPSVYVRLRKLYELGDETAGVPE